MSDSEDDIPQELRHEEDDVAEISEEEQEGSEEEEEDEEEQMRPRKKKKRKTNIFIEEEADVDESDEEEEEEEEDGFEKEEFEELAKTYDDTRHRALNQRIQREKEMDVEEIAQRMKQRYGRSEISRGAFRGDVDHVPQNMLIPSVNDPKLWLVRCKPGKERLIISNLMRKFFDLQFSPTPLRILSAVFRDSLQGYIYIEAEKQADVSHAIEMTSHVYGTKLALVPVGEMVDCLTVKSKTLDIKEGAWVRAKRGVYAGDLCQVLEVLESGDSVLVKLIPRLDLTDQANGNGTSKRKKNGADLRPPQKLFNINEVNRRNVSNIQGGYIYQKDTFDKDGYLEKQIKLSSLQINDVNPTLEEITKFSGGTLTDRADDLAALANASLAGANDFQVGDKIIVQSGDLKNIPGTVQSVENGTVTILPDPTYGLTGTLRYPAQDLAKHFTEGDHVKVMNGVHKDETGLILKTDDNVVTILSDSSLQPIQVFSKDLKIAAEISNTSTSIGQYSLEDLVQTAANNVGVVVKIEKDCLIVLNQYGKTDRCQLNTIRGKRDFARATTHDSSGRPLSVADAVIVDDGTVGGMKKRATVLHIFRDFVFLKSREVLENNGLFATKGRFVSLIGGKVVDPRTGGPRMAPPGMQGNGAGRGMMQNRGGFANSGRGGKRDPLISQTVNVCGGPYKGYVGIVKDVTATHARVELHTGNRTITVEKERVIPVGQNRGQSTTRPDSQVAFGSVDFDGGRTPMYQESAKTPMHRPGDSGSRTPAWDLGSKTPGYAGNNTPSWSSNRRESNAHPYNPGYSMSYQNALSDDTPGHVNTPFVPDNVPTPAGLPQTPAAYPHTGSVNPNTPFISETPAESGSTEFFKSRPESKLSGFWLTTDIEVKFLSNGQHGVIKSVDSSSKTCTVRILNSNETKSSVDMNQLAPVPPERRQPFKVIGPDNNGVIGSLLSIDNHEGVVRLEGRAEILMMNLNTLARYVKE